MPIRHDSGIVLRSFPFGEADRVVVLLSPDNGKLRTVAKGIRKTKSRFGGRLEPFTHVELVLYEGRNLDTITQVDAIESFPRLREDLDRVTAASTMLETADAVAQENEQSRALFGLLQNGLRVLEGGPRHPDLVTAYLLHLAGVVGLAPSLSMCASCGTHTGVTRFSFSGGGAICGSCAVEGTIRIRPGVVQRLADLASASLVDLPAPSPDLTGEAMGLAKRFVEYHLDRRLQSMTSMDS